MHCNSPILGIINNATNITGLSLMQMLGGPYDKMERVAVCVCVCVCVNVSVCVRVHMFFQASEMYFFSLFFFNVPAPLSSKRLELPPCSDCFPASSLPQYSMSVCMCVPDPHHVPGTRPGRDSWGPAQTSRRRRVSVPSTRKLSCQSPRVGWGGPAPCACVHMCACVFFAGRLRQPHLDPHTGCMLAWRFEWELLFKGPVD